MSYIINNSRGNIVAVVAAGTVNTTSTPITLVGQGVTNYGTAENENYVWILENFCNTTAPSAPLLGQLWYNNATDTLSAYNSTNTWTAIASQDYVKAQKISPAFTGTPTAPTAADGTNNTQLATTRFVGTAVSNYAATAAVIYAPLISASLSGTPTAPTANTTTNTNQIATTAFVQAQKTNPVFTGTVSTTGNVVAANFVGNVISPAGSEVSTTGNITGGNITTGGIVSATGNVIGANFIGNVIPPAGGAVSTTGNITGGNIITSGVVSATGNVIGANFIGNVIPPAGGAVSTTGNVTGGNIITSGVVSATGNITGNNITGGNITTNGIVSAAGNITTSNTLIADTVIANTVITTGTSSAFRLPNLTQTQINLLSPQNGDMVYNTTTNYPQVYQNGEWKIFTLSFYS
jgi:hypothetical protein